MIDSLSILKSVTFLEEKYGIQIETHEADVDNLNTFDSIANLAQSKL